MSEKLEVEVADRLGGVIEVEPYRLGLPYFAWIMPTGKHGGEAGLKLA